MFADSEIFERCLNVRTSQMANDFEVLSNTYSQTLYSSFEFIHYQRNKDANHEDLKKLYIKERRDYVVFSLFKAFDILVGRNAILMGKSVPIYSSFDINFNGIAYFIANSCEHDNGYGKRVLSQLMNSEYFNTVFKIIKSENLKKNNQRLGWILKELNNQKHKY